MSQYPEDEFDRLGRERRDTGVAGAHRLRPNNRPWWIALVAVLILAPLAGWGIVQAMANHGSSTLQAPVASASATPSAAPAAPSAAPSASAQAPAPAPSSAAASPTPTPTPTPDADQGLTILVLNATGRTGYAAQIQAQLKGDGWANTEIGTYKHARPAASQIFYDSADHAAAAKALGEKLGITDLELNPNATGDYPIIVVLAQ